MDTSKPGKANPSKHRSTLSLQKTQVVINVYDLLPPGRLSAVLWNLGTSLCHSGVVIRDKEYAYGGHDKRGLTGVYWTRPRTEPPGARFRCEILQGFTLQTEKEVDAIIREVSEEFLGSSYNLLNQNCNHFTNALCERLTSRPAPNWLNRAASIGVAFPCVVPRDWLAPPDHETAEGELLDDDTEDESSMMLQSRQLESEQHELDEADGLEGLTAPETESDSDEETGNVASDGKGRENASIRDTSGRLMPPSERAPQPTS